MSGEPCAIVESVWATATPPVVIASKIIRQVRRNTYIAGFLFMSSTPLLDYCNDSALAVVEED